MSLAAMAADGDEGDNGANAIASPTRFEFEHCAYTVRVRADGRALASQSLAKVVATKSKALLHEVSAAVVGGEVMYVMGPSGAGKTTLLRLLSLQPMGGTPSGDVRLDGAPFNRARYRAACASVEQEGSLWAFLTCREHLEYAVALCASQLTPAAQRSEVDALLGALGLESCERVRAGNALVKGLSGGQTFH